MPATSRIVTRSGVIRYKRPVEAVLSEYAARWDTQALWKLDEASGNAADAVGSNTLTDVNTVTSGAALATNLGTSRQFTAASAEAFTIADNAALSIASNLSFVVFGWFLLDAVGADFYAVHKGTGITAATQAYALLYSNSQTRFRFSIGDSLGATVTNLNFSSLGAPSIGVPYFLCCGYDAAAGQLFARGNGGAIDTGSTSGRFPPDDTGSFRLGERPGANRWGGRMSNVGIVKPSGVALSTVLAEINSRVYAAGAGRAFPWTGA